MMFATLAVPLAVAMADEAALASIHRDIEKKYAQVSHVSGGELATMLAAPEQADDIVLFDVREVGEHAVSHLDNAVQVKPGIWTSTFLKKHGSIIKGKTVVFYCSVGRRSSYAASYLQDALMKQGAKRVVNLTGGIFSWHNNRRPLKDADGKTALVHPYNSYWGRLVARENLTAYSPLSRAQTSTQPSLTGGATNAVPSGQ
ncbi:MAG: rhodanese-like domain-containing protein [Pseudomonadota bacterium]